MRFLLLAFSKAWSGLAFLVMGVAVFPFAIISLLGIFVLKGPLSYHLYRVIFKVCFSVIVCAFGTRIVWVGKPLSKKQNHLIIANHRSNADIPALVCSVPGLCVFLLKSELLQIPIVGSGLRFYMVAIDRKGGLGEGQRALDACREKLLSGTRRNLVIFPEGRRSRNGRLQSFHSGAFSLASQNVAPCVLSYIEESNKSWPLGDYIPLPGRTIRVHHVATMGGEDCARYSADELRNWAWKKLYNYEQELIESKITQKGKKSL